MTLYDTLTSCKKIIKLLGAVPEKIFAQTDIIHASLCESRKYATCIRMESVTVSRNFIKQM